LLGDHDETSSVGDRLSGSCVSSGFDPIVGPLFARLFFVIAAVGQLREGVCWHVALGFASIAGVTP
jgi:hypothetical protein